MYPHVQYLVSTAFQKRQLHQMHQMQNQQYSQQNQQYSQQQIQLQSHPQSNNLIFLF